MTVVRPSALLLALCAASLGQFISSPARAQQSSGKECAEAYEKAQEQRAESKLLEAKEKLVVCAQASCPGFIKKDCTKWLGEVEGQIPTVVFSATDKSGKELSDVKVSVDGNELVSALDGRAVPANPGRTTFVFEHAQFGTKEVALIVKEGQKSQQVSAVFEAGAPEAPPAGEQLKLDESSPVLPIILAGVGAVGIGSFAFFALTGKSDENELRDSGCSPNCSQDDVDSVKQKYLIADISLGVGVVSLGIATYLFLNPPRADAPAGDEKAALRFDVRGLRGGGFAGLQGSF